MNSWGNIFRLTIWGESHGAEVGVSIDGVPAGIALSEEDFVATLENKALGKTKFSHYAYTKETLPQDDSLIEADDKISSRKGALEIAIEAQSVAVYVEK
jgi:hypothetical protein